MIGDPTTEILIGNGIPEPLLPDRSGRERAVIFTQPGALRTAAAISSLIDGPVLELPDRDEAKSLRSLGEAYHWLAANQVGRHDTIVGVGGGAVTDLAGFAAATWLRGIEVVHVPTTLLGALDAAIGGKTGINLEGKNLVGAFHPPTRVVIDLDLLASLPEELRLEGVAEALKAGLVADPALVDLFTRRGSQADLREMVERSVRVKVEVVEEDFREQGRRAILNFGHTIGHGIEIAGAMPHGLAVAVGMVAEGAISAIRFGFPARWLTDLIFSLGLPVASAGPSSQTVLDLIAHDKKRTSDGVRVVLLRAVADPVLEVVSEDELRMGLTAVGIG